MAGCLLTFAGAGGAHITGAVLLDELGGVRRTFLKDASSVLNDEEYSHLAEDLVKITQLIKGAYNPIMQENIRREEVLAQLESFHNIALLKSRLEALRRP